MNRLLMAAFLMLALSACGSVAAASVAPTPVPFITPAPTKASETPPTPSPTPSVATTPPVRVPAAPPPTTPTLSGAFPIAGIGQSNVSGLVRVSESGGRFIASVSVRGLPVGMPTLHAVHIHAGSCANPLAGMHLTVLGTLRADAGGAGSFSAGLAGTYLSRGRYVIIYASQAPQVIVGCANLAPLS